MSHSSLSRFLHAQAADYPTALSEIKSGRKRSHWMWYIFPQLAGLGMSPMSVKFAIRDIHEAKDYLAHPVLGNRLKEICRALLTLQGNNATDIFGTPDDLKLRSSMTLFAAADPSAWEFAEVLEKYFEGEPDQKTLELLNP